MEKFKKFQLDVQSMKKIKGQIGGKWVAIREGCYMLPGHTASETAGILGGDDCVPKYRFEYIG